MKIAVLGAGAWGTTLSVLLNNNGHNVTLWEYKKSYAQAMLRERENTTYLPGIKLPDELLISTDIKDAVKNKNIIVIAIPTQFVRKVIEKISYKDVEQAIFVSVSKGIEIKTLLTVSQIIKNIIPKLKDEQIAVLSGPSHAEEVIKKIPTTVVAASKSLNTSQTIQSTFMNSYFRVYSSTDVLGVELGGAFKNVIAIGAGIIDGAGYGDNTKAAIMTRGIAEISRLGIALGAKPETFSGLSGVGDLIVTCMSRHSRNRYVGERIGKGEKLKDILKNMYAVAEGVETSRSANELAKKYKVEVPITTEVYKILFEDKDPIKATNDLMTRDMKLEYYK